MGAVRYNEENRFPPSFMKGDEKYMQKKKTFSTMEIVLLVVLTGSLILSFLQAWREENQK